MYRVHKPSTESRFDVRVPIGRSGGGEALDGPPLGLRARGQTTTRADEIGRVAMYNAFYKTFMSVRARLARAREEDEDARDGGRDDVDARVGMTWT